MKVLLAIDRDRISPVLDAARCFLLITARPDGALIRKEFVVNEFVVNEAELLTTVKRIVELRCDVLICGAISWPLENMLISAGMKVIPNTCGPLDEVIEAFFSGKLTERAFLMPGCPGRQHRRGRRHGRRRRNGW